MGNSKLTLIGMYNWDNTILDKLSAPTSFSLDDIEILKMNILRECGEFEVLWSDWDFFQSSIEWWSKKNKPNWDELYETTQYEYNPIHNYDRTETHSSLETRNLSTSDAENRNLTWQDKRTANLTGSNTETRNLANSESNTGTVSTALDSTESQTGSSTVTKSGRAFNDADLVTKESESTSSSGSTTLDSDQTETRNLSTSGTNTGTIQNSSSEGGTDTHDGKDQGSINRTGSNTGTVGVQEEIRASGNIGVMSTQQMIEQQREVVKFNLMDYIINEFKHEFCIMKY